MAIRFASILVPIFLAFAGLGAVAVLEYEKHKIAATSLGTKELGPVEYIRERYAAFKTKRAVEAAVREFSIAKALPAAPEGWTRAEYEVAHGIAITGATFEPSAIAKDTEKSIQDAFRFVKRKKRVGAVASYINGAQIVSLKIRQVKTPDPNTLEGGLAVRLNAVGEALKPPANAYGRFGGTQFLVLPQESLNYFSQERTPVTYRRIEGNFAALFDIFVFTNADDAAVNAVLDGIDYVLLEDYVRATLDAQDAVADAAPIAAEEQAEEGQAAQAEPAANEEADTAQASVAEAAEEQGGSLLARIGDLFAANGADEAEQEAPRRMICTIQKGYKRCVFPKEDD